MSILLVVHVVLIVLDYIMLTAYSTACHIAAKFVDGPKLKSLFQDVSIIASTGRAILIVGMIIGIYLARPYSFSTPWLIASYLLIIISMSVRVAVLEPFQKRLIAAAENEIELTVLRTSKTPLYASLLNCLLLIAIFYLMFLKPNIG